MNERSIFVEALDREDLAERTAYLDGACGEDVALRKRVESLLRSYSHAESFLESPPDALIATIAGGDLEASDEISLDFLEASDKPGCLGTLAQYEVVEVVGRGGMGVVLRAYDTKLNRVVAIKVIAPEFATNPLAVKRFLREARAAAAMNHDHVVTIHAIHDLENPPFLVMEFIEGQSLLEKLERTGGFDVQEILRIGMQAAAGLAAAHDQGIVHRDIKPANILLENGVERVKITDFGLAREINDTNVTQVGVITGTPEYMSPEQARGAAIDHRSDLFSLGAVLYTMCTGRSPFKRENTVATLQAVLEGAPRSIREINPEIPVWLEEMIARLLAKEPEERLQTAREVADLFRDRLANPRGQEQEDLEPTDKRFEVFQSNKKTHVPLRTVHLVFSLLCIAHVLGVAGTVTCMAEEIEAALPMLPLLSVIGLIIAFDGWRIARSWGSIAYGASTAILATLLVLITRQLDLHPSAGDEVVFYVVVLAYAVAAVPSGLIVLVTVMLEPEDRWPKRLQFSLAKVLATMVVAGFAFFTIQFTLRVFNSQLRLGSSANVLLAVTSGMFVVTVFATSAVTLYIVQKLADRGQLPDARRWRRRVMIGTAVVLVVCLGLATFYYRMTNEGRVIFRSPVEVRVERLRDGQVERTYRIMQGGGTRWLVPVGEWEFRIKGSRTDYRLSQTNVTVTRGSVTNVQIIPTKTTPALVESNAWDRLIEIAEAELAAARTRADVGTDSIASVLQAQAGVIEAKIQRARSAKRKQEVRSLLEELITIREQELESIQALHRTGKVAQSYVQATIKALAEAQAALEEASVGE